MNEDKSRDVTMTALPLFRVPFTQYRSAKQWWIVFILEVYHVRNGRVMWCPAVTIHACRRNSMRLLSHVTPDNEDRFLNSAITSELNLALNLVPSFPPSLSWSLAAVSSFFGCDWWPEATRGHGHWMETGNESGIGFEDDLSSPTNFFLGRIRVWRPSGLVFAGQVIGDKQLFSKFDVSQN